MLLAIIGLIIGGLAIGLLIRWTIFFMKYTAEWINTGQRPDVFPRPHRCPRCEARVASRHKLRSLREAILGGWTCPGCGSVFDQLDRALVARAWNAHLRDSRVRLRREHSRELSEDSRSPVQKLIDE